MSRLDDNLAQFKTQVGFHDAGVARLQAEPFRLKCVESTWFPKPYSAHTNHCTNPLDTNSGIIPECVIAYASAPCFEDKRMRLHFPIRRAVAVTNP